MKSYAHPIKNEAGEDTGEWCYEHKGKTTTEDEPFEPTSGAMPQLGLIDGQWFRENLAKIQEAKKDSWVNDKLLNYLTKSYHVEAETVEQAVSKLGKEAAGHFTKKMQDALDSIEH